MAENPDLELEEAADPKRLVSIFFFIFWLALAYEVLAGEIGKTNLEAANIMLMVSLTFCI